MGTMAGLGPYPAMGPVGHVIDVVQTILVVEDEALIRMSAVAALEDAGFTVLEACNSAEALMILAEHDEIGVLLTDVFMPGRQDGLALVAQARRDFPLVRAIIVSAHASADQAGR